MCTDTCPLTEFKNIRGRVVQRMIYCQLFIRYLYNVIYLVTFEHNSYAFLFEFYWFSFYLILQWTLHFQLIQRQFSLFYYITSIIHYSVVKHYKITSSWFRKTFYTCYRIHVLNIFNTNHTH